jgi:hypothetical protein
VLREFEMVSIRGQLSPAGDQRIERDAFARQFREAVEASVAFAATMARQHLPASRCFLIEPNASFDENPLKDDEQRYPGDSLPPGRMLGPLTFEQALAWLWRDGKVPEWVDVSVHNADRRHTYMRVVCCGRFTGLERLLYYQRLGGRAPFGVKSPVFPPDVNFEAVRAGARFDLPGHWRARLRRLIIRWSWRLRSWLRGSRLT